jgi:hypothetical protein
MPPIDPCKKQWFAILFPTLPMRGNMKKLMIAVMVIVSAYLTATVYTGFLFDKKIGELNRQLTASEGMQVHNLAYKRGIFSGKLHYDVEYRMDELIDRIFEEGGLVEEQRTKLLDWLRLEGEVDVKHGPFIGGGNGFAVAWFKTELMLPEQLHSYLPEHPGSTPWAQVVTVMGFDGMAKSVVTGMNYDGTIRDPEGDVGRIIGMTLENWGATINLNTRLNMLGLSAYLGKMSFSVEEAEESNEFEIQDLQLESNSIKQTELLWDGDSRFSIAKMHLREDEVKTDIRNFVIEAESIFKGDTFDNTIAIRSGEIKNSDGALKGVAIDIALNDISVVAYETLMRSIQSNQAQFIAGDEAQVAEALRKALSEVFHDFLAAGPTLTIEKVGILLADGDDISGHLKIHYPPSAPVDIRNPESILKNIGIEGGISVSIGTLEKVSLLVAEYQSREQETNYGSPMSAAQIEAVALESFSNVMATVSIMPFFLVSEAGVQCNFETKEGWFYANEHMVFYLGDLMQYL